MKIIEKIQQLEKEGNGFSLDVMFSNKDGEVLHASYDSYYTLEGIKADKLNVEDYYDINTLDYNDFKKSELIKVFRNFFNRKYYSDKYDFREGVILEGETKIAGETYSYELGITF